MLCWIRRRILDLGWVDERWRGHCHGHGGHHRYRWCRHYYKLSMILAETGGVPGRGLSSWSRFLRITAQLHRQGRAGKHVFNVYSLNLLVLASNLRYVSNTFLLYQLFVVRWEKIFSNWMKDIHLLRLLALNQEFYQSSISLTPKPSYSSCWFTLVGRISIQI